MVNHRKTYVKTPNLQAGVKALLYAQRLAHTVGMAGTTTDTQTPTFEMRHRMALALEVAGVTKEAMADYIGVSRQTISNYLIGRTVPTIGYVRNWADRCQVSVSWLLTGHADTDTDDRDYPSGNTSALAA